MKRSLAFLLASILMIGLTAAPSVAGKKKKKKKPVPITETITFEADGSIHGPAPTGLAVAGITEGEFTRVNTCASPPATQGVDGYVIELPAEFQDGNATLEIAGGDATGAYDMDLYFYDGSCALMEPYLTDGANPAGGILPGAKWAVVNLFVGAEATFKLTATNTVVVTP